MLHYLLQIVNNILDFKFNRIQCTFPNSFPFIIGSKNLYWYCIGRAWNCFAKATEFYWYFIVKIKMTRIGIIILLQKKPPELVLVFYGCQKVCHAEP